VAAAVVVLALAIVVYQFMGSSGGETYTEARKFFSVDDGATYFADDGKKVAPFQHEGKEAVEAIVYSCDGGATKQVLYLVKFTPGAKPLMEKANAGDQAQDVDLLLTTGRQVKKPGMKEWVKIDHPNSGLITEPKCPGGLENAKAILP
jgi:hypothetical protein